jgi:hypothetical protein
VQLPELLRWRIRWLPISFEGKEMADQPARVKEVACQQVLLADGSVFSIQWIDLPERAGRRVTPTFLLQRYLGFLSRFTWTLVRPVSNQSGIAFRIAGTTLPLLRFLPPKYRDLPNGHAVDLDIEDGLLVQPGARRQGRFSLISERTNEGVRITVELSGYFPLLLGGSSPPGWRRCLYRLTQSLVHKEVTARYLLRLHRELTGERFKLKLRKVAVREGSEI